MDRQIKFDTTKRTERVLKKIVDAQASRTSCQKGCQAAESEVMQTSKNEGKSIQPSLATSFKFIADFFHGPQTPSFRHGFNLQDKADLDTAQDCNCIERVEKDQRWRRS